MNKQRYRRPNARKEICAAALRILDENCASPKVYELVRKASDDRQLAMAKQMEFCSNFSVSMANTLLAVTLDSELRKGKSNQVYGISRSELAIMRKEFRPLAANMIAAGERYSVSCLHLAVAAAYARRLVSNGRVSAFLRSRHPDELVVLQIIASTWDVCEPGSTWARRLVSRCP